MSSIYASQLLSIDYTFPRGHYSNIFCKKIEVSSVQSSIPHRVAGPRRISAGKLAPLLHGRSSYPHFYKAPHFLHSK